MAPRQGTAPACVRVAERAGLFRGSWMADVGGGDGMASPVCRVDADEVARTASSMPLVRMVERRRGPPMTSAMGLVARISVSRCAGETIRCGQEPRQGGIPFHRAR